MENENIDESFENDTSDGSETSLSENEEEIESEVSEEINEYNEGEESSEEIVGESEDLGEVMLGDLLAELSVIDGRLEAWETVENTYLMSRNVNELNFIEGSLFIIILGVLFIIGYWFIGGRGD